MLHFVVGMIMHGYNMVEHSVTGTNNYTGANYRNGSYIHGMNILRMMILVNICDFIFTNLLAS